MRAPINSRTDDKSNPRVDIGARHHAI